MLERIEASAGFVKLDLKIPGRRWAWSLARHAGSGADAAFLKSRPSRQSHPAAWQPSRRRCAEAFRSFRSLPPTALCGDPESRGAHRAQAPAIP